MADPEVHVTLDDGVVTVVLNRPQKRNALTRAVLASVVEHLRQAEAQDAAVVVLTGTGSAFCAGWDLDDLRALPDTDGAALSLEIQEGLRAIERCEVPVIAAVNGPARGGGCGIACAADIRIFAEGASIGVPEVGIGTIPGGGIIRRLAELTGPGIAAEMLLTGEPVAAARAAEVGLANAVVADDAVHSAALACARRIARHPRPAVRAAKRVLRAVGEVDDHTLVQSAAAEIGALLALRTRAGAGR